MKKKISKDKVSIIIPFYKNLQYISKSIRSVINQTYKNYEIILVYDDTDRADLKFITNKFNLHSNHIARIDLYLK